MSTEDYLLKLIESKFFKSGVSFSGQFLFGVMLLLGVGIWVTGGKLIMPLVYLLVGFGMLGFINEYFKSGGPGVSCECGVLMNPTNWKCPVCGKTLG